MVSGLIKCVYKIKLIEQLELSTSLLLKTLTIATITP